MMTRYTLLFSGHNVVAIKKLTRYTPEFLPGFHSVAIIFGSIRNSAFFLQRVNSCELQWVTPLLPHSGGYSSPRRSSRLSGSAKFDVVRDLHV